MCTSPISVKIRVGEKVAHFDRPSYLRPYRPARGSEFYDKILPREGDYVTVPCGRCCECLRKRQNDLAVRASNEAAKRGSMVFVTLTYNKEHLPFSSVLSTVDKDTGELTYSQREVFCSGSSSHDNIDNLNLVHQVRERYASYRKTSRPVYMDHVFYDGDDMLAKAIFTPSVCRRDVQLWLKSSRVAYKREHGVPLSDFSYLCCQEYGPKTCRPHVHICFFGLSKKEVDYLCYRWSSKDFLHYGYTKQERVKAANDDGSPGFSICARYIAKYCSKGVFECESVKRGFSERPRLMISKGLGMSLTPALISYFRCDDILGEIDQMAIRFNDGSFCSRSNLLYLSEFIKERSHITVGKSSYCLPRSYIRKLWYFYDENTNSFRSTSLRRALVSLVPSDPIENYLRELKRDYPGITPAVYLPLLSTFEACLQSNLSFREKTAHEYLQSCYAKSIF